MITAKLEAPSFREGRIHTDLRHLCKAGWGAALTLNKYSDIAPLPCYQIRKELGEAIHENRKSHSFEHTFLCPGWNLHFKLRKLAAKRAQFVGQTNYGIRKNELRDRIVEKVRGKTSKYGTLPVPLIVAVNLKGTAPSVLEQALDAMYGHERYAMPIDDSGIPDFMNGRMQRAPDGICHLSSRSEHLDSCLFFANAGAWSLQQPPHVRIQNPYCKFPSIGVLRSAPEIAVHKSKARIITINSQAYPLGPEQRWFHEFPTKKNDGFS